jgi:short-subunit dehydrogenase
LVEQVVIITGASSGIGAACAEMFGARGYRVVLAARRLERLEARVEQITARGGQALAVKTDVTEPDQNRRLIERTLSAYGRIDILINNAGIGKLRWLDEQDPEGEIPLQIQVNLTAPLQLSRLVLPHFLERGSGQIVNVASGGAWLAVPTYSVYTATKYGLRGFTRSLRRELRGTSIRVTGVYPGSVDTEFDQQADVGWEIQSETPPWLLLSPEEVAAKIYQAVQTGKSTVIIPWVLRIPIALEVLWPGLMSWIFSKFFKRVNGKTIAWGREEGEK